MMTTMRKTGRPRIVKPELRDYMARKPGWDRAYHVWDVKFGKVTVTVYGFREAVKTASDLLMGRM